MASPYSLTNGTNGTNGGQLGKLLGDIVRTLIPVVMAVFALYQVNVTHREQAEADHVEIARLREDVAYLLAHFASKDDVKDLIQPLREASTDEKAAIRDLERWLRDQQTGRGYGRQQPN